MGLNFSAEALPLKATVSNTIMAAAFPEGFFTFIYDADYKVAKGAYRKAGFVKVPEIPGFTFVVNVTIPKGFTNRELAIEAVYRIAKSRLVCVVEELASEIDNEDTLRREIRAVRELAVTASNLGLAAEENYFSTLLTAVKESLVPLVEARQEKIKEQQHTAL